MSSSQLHQYNATSRSLISQSLNIVRPYLPTCLPLHRRLQFGRFSDDSVIFTNVDYQCLNIYAPEQEPFLVAFVDRGCRPETEVWMFGSWEVDMEGGAWEKVREMLRDLAGRVKGLRVPRSIHEHESGTSLGQGDGNGSLDQSGIAIATPPSSTSSNGEKDSVGYSREDYAGHASDPNIMLWGAIHERTVPILQGLGVLSTEFKTGLVPNSTFVFTVDDLPQVRPLPAGLEWSKVEPKDFALVRRRTQIPRQERTMAVLPSLAIRTDESEPVAWAFVGLDGSLTTLHVESEWRGRGLAKAIATKLFREKMHPFWEAGVEKMSHGYVVSGNEASEATSRSLGGRCGWQSYWLRVKLGEV